MRLDPDARMIKVRKSKLINKIIDNKNAHIEGYEKAVIAYKMEAIKELEKQLKRAKEGKTDISVNLTSPVDRAGEYDKLTLMFEMEVREEVKLSQGEFNQYIHDELTFAKHAKAANTLYISKG